MPISPTTPIPSGSVALVVAALGTRGWSADRCAAYLRLSPEDLGAGGFIQARHAIRLLDLADELGIGDEADEVAAAIPPGALGLLEHLCRAAPTHRQALQDLSRYFGLVAFGASVDVLSETLVFRPPPGTSLSHATLLAQLFFAFVEHRLRRQAPLGTVIKTLPEAGEAIATASFESDHLDAPIPETDPTLRRLLDGYARMELTRQGGETTIAARVQAALVEGLPGSVPGAGEVARMLGMSARSLRRSLAQEHTTYSAVRDQCLRLVAEQALRDPSRAIGEVAWLLGYSEASAFHRAFRRWTGTSPERFRQIGRPGQ